jgi:hypothetical protein
MRFWRVVLYNFSNMNIVSKKLQWNDRYKYRVSPSSLISFDRSYVPITSDILKLIVDVLKIGLPIAYALGLFTISRYLSIFGAPLLISDLSTTLWFINVAALITFGAIFLAATVFFVPAFFFSTSSRSLRYTPTTRPRSLLSPQAQKEEFVIQWSTSNGVAFTALFAWTILWYLNMSLATLVIVSMLVVIIWILLTGYLLHHYSWFYKKLLEKKPAKAPLKLLSALTARVLSYSLAKAGWTFGWTIAVVYLIDVFSNLAKFRIFG